MTNSQLNLFHKKLFLILGRRYQDHWDSSNPSKGQGYRAIRISENNLDPVLLEALHQSNISPKKFIICKPFTMWIDPGSVEFRVGHHGSIVPYYPKM